MDLAVVVELAFFIELHWARDFVWLDLPGVEGLAIVSEVAVWFVNALLVHTTEPPTGNLYTLWIVADALHLDRDRARAWSSFSSADQATDAVKISAPARGKSDT